MKKTARKRNRTKGSSRSVINKKSTKAPLKILNQIIITPFIYPVGKMEGKKKKIVVARVGGNEMCLLSIAV